MDVEKELKELQAKVAYQTGEIKTLTIMVNALRARVHDLEQGMKPED